MLRMFRQLSPPALGAFLLVLNLVNRWIRLFARNTKNTLTLMWRKKIHSFQVSRNTCRKVNLKKSGTTESEEKEVALPTITI